MQDYYFESTGKKVKDFLIGFFGVLIFGGILILTPVVIINSLFSDEFVVSGVLSILFFSVLIFVYAGLVIFSFRKGRRYVSIGMMFPFVILLLFYFFVFLAVSFSSW